MEEGGEEDARRRRAALEREREGRCRQNGSGVRSFAGDLGGIRRRMVVGKTNLRGVAEGTSVDERLFQATALLALRPELSSCTSSSRSSAATSSSAYRQCRDAADSTRLREKERERETAVRKQGAPRS